MPIDTLADEAQSALKGAQDFLRSEQPDEKSKRFHVTSLQSIEHRLRADIEERTTTYVTQLHSSESAEIDALWSKLSADPRFVRLTTQQKAHQQTFDSLRHINGGAFPNNISPVLYVLPLILVGVAEWYVNYSTFAAIFIPVFAIAGTLLVAAVFAWASHMHGSYLKQLSEIIHPSVEYRNVLGRKIAVIIATALLIAGLLTVVWLRYVVITDQLGINPNVSSGTFGQPSSWMIWARLGPTIVLNLIIWGLGTLYAWGMSEKIPGLRESFRDLSTANTKSDRTRRPFVGEEQRIRARYDREREKNQVAIREYRNSLNVIGGVMERIKG